MKHENAFDSLPKNVFNVDTCNEIVLVSRSSSEVAIGWKTFSILKTISSTRSLKKKQLPDASTKYVKQCLKCLHCAQLRLGALSKQANSLTIGVSAARMLPSRLGSTNGL